MSVIQAISPQGKTIATLVNYAIHPEVLGNDDRHRQPRPDRPALRQDRGRKSGGTALFMNGAQGGMVTADNRNLDQPKDPIEPTGTMRARWEECLRIGHLMAAEALRIVKDAPVQNDPALFCDAISVRFPVESDRDVGRDRRFAAEVSA